VNTAKSRPSTWRRLAGAALAVALGASLAACAPADAGRVKLDFFQFKPEAVANFQGLAAEFEAKNPGIDVVINSVPDPDTAIRTLLVKGKTPDVLTLNGNGNFGDLAASCVFADLSAFPAASRTKPEIQEILDSLGTCHGSETNGLPFANNASAILYNPDIFAKYNVAVPRTWDELIAAADTFKDNGVAPFHMTLKDAWTVLPAYVNLAGNLKPAGFFQDIRSSAWTPQNGTHSFAADGVEAAEKLKKLFSYRQPGADSDGYNDGNAAFAAGKSAMYLQGSFAIPAIRAANPEARIASFPYPTTNNPADTTLVTGVDVTLAMGRDTKHPTEAAAFIEFLMRSESMKDYAEAQSALVPLKDAGPIVDPALAGVQDIFERGRLIGYFDHQVPTSIPFTAMLQQFMLDGDTTAFLDRADREFAKAAARTATKKGE
jgi:raffinose/stachyose/melibiose transport system substrate-binding protein